MSRRTTQVLTGSVLALAMAAGSAPAQATEDAKPTKLVSGQEQSHAVPGPTGHMYKYTTTTKYWSVIGTDTTTGIDVDLRLYGDKGEDELLAASVYGQGAVDFIAVDSNHRELDTYFPRIDAVSDVGGGYDIQFAGSGIVLTTQPQEVAMVSNELFAVRDTFLEACKTYRFVLSPGTGLMDADLFLMASSASSESSWVTTRSSAVDTGAANPGAPVIMEYTAPRSDWYGLVISRAGVNGTYDLVRTTL
jgi:hypothetical protein